MPHRHPPTRLSYFQSTQKAITKWAPLCSPWREQSLTVQGSSGSQTQARTPATGASGVISVLLPRAYPAYRPHQGHWGEPAVCILHRLFSYS